MPSRFSGAPIQKRLASLQQQFIKAFPPERRTGLCLWLTESTEENRMIDALVETENTDGAQFQDIFLHLELASLIAAELPRQCQERIQLQLEVEAEEMKAIGMPEKLWLDPPKVYTYPQLAAYINSITNYLPHFEGRVFLYVNPGEVREEGAFAEALLEALSSPLQPGILFMLAAGPRSTLARRLSEAEEAGVMVLHPDLDMEAAANEVLQSGADGDPTATYLSNFQQLAELGRRGDWKGMRSVGESLLDQLAKQPNGAINSAAVLTTMGTLYFTKRRKRSDALHCFQRARGLAEALIAEGNTAGNGLLVQILTYEARAEFKLKNYDRAATAYRRAAPLLEGPAYAYSRFEFYRQAMLSAQKGGQAKTAFADGLKALRQAAEIPRDQLSQVSLPAFEQDLLTLAAAAKQTGQRAAISQQIRALWAAEN